VQVPWLWSLGDAARKRGGGGEVRLEQERGGELRTWAGRRKVILSRTRARGWEGGGGWGGATRAVVRVGEGGMGCHVPGAGGCGPVTSAAPSSDGQEATWMLPAV
jgi:hypothetical protein